VLSVYCVAKLSLYFIVYAVNLIFMNTKIVINIIPVRYFLFKSNLITKCKKAFLYFEVYKVQENKIQIKNKLCKKNS
jgi:hypothetical protein